MEINFKTSNSAFDEECRGSLEYETIRILKEICEKVENGHDHGVIMDINGNEIGSWKL